VNALPRPAHASEADSQLTVIAKWPKYLIYAEIGQVGPGTISG
jgi:hypothetical protein